MALIDKMDQFFPLKLRFESELSPLLLIQFRISHQSAAIAWAIVSQKPAKGIRKQLLGCSFQLRAKPTDMSLETPGPPTRGLLLEQTRSELI